MTRSSYGLWWAPDDPNSKVAGQLTWGDLRSPRLSLLEATNQMWVGPGQAAQLAAGHGAAPGTELVPVLHGRLADHGIVTLLASRFAGINIGSTQTQTLQASEALVGAWLDDPEEKFLRRIEIDMPALEAVIGIFPITHVKDPSGRAARIDYRLDHRRITWKRDGVEVIWEYKWSSHIGRTSADISMTPTMTLASGRPRSLTFWVNEWIVPLNRLMQIATGSSSRLRAVTGWEQKKPTPQQRAGSSVEIWMRGVGDHDPGHDPHDVFMPAGAIALNPGGIHDVVHEVLRLSLEQEAFLGLLSDVIVFQDRPLRNRYLDIVGALEAFHTQIKGRGPVPSDEFKAERKDTIASLRSAEADAAAVRFVKRWLPSESHYALDRRLNDLGKLVGVADSWSIDALAMARLRNKVAHGDTEVADHNLQAAYEQAFTLARFLVFRELGMVNPPAGSG